MLLFNADLSVVDFCKENGVVLGLPFSRSRIESMFVDLPSSLTLSCKKNRNKNNNITNGKVYYDDYISKINK